MTSNLLNLAQMGPQLGFTSTTTASGVALDSAYVYAASGKAIGVRFVSPTTSNLTKVYAFVSATAGTPGVLTCQHRNVANYWKPGTSLLATTTATPVSGEWITFTFGAPAGCTCGVTYWVVIGDAGWTSGNTSNVLTVPSMSAPADNFYRLMHYVSTTDGFTTNGNAGDNGVPVILAFADGTVMGIPFTTWSADASSTQERGIKVTFDEQVVIGAVYAGPFNSISGLKIYSGTTAPGGTPDATITFDATAVTAQTTLFAPFTCAKSTVYRFVFTYGGASVAPGYFQIQGTTPPADVLATGFWGGAAIHTQDNGAGGWTDSTSKFPKMVLRLKNQVAISGGGAIDLPEPLIVGA